MPPLPNSITEFGLLISVNTKKNDAPLAVDTPIENNGDAFSVIASFQGLVDAPYGSLPIAEVLNPEVERAIPDALRKAKRDVFGALPNLVFPQAVQLHSTNPYKAPSIFSISLPEISCQVGCLYFHLPVKASYLLKPLERLEDPAEKETKTHQQCKDEVETCCGDDESCAHANASDDANDHACQRSNQPLRHSPLCHEQVLLRPRAQRSEASTLYAPFALCFISQTEALMVVQDMLSFIAHYLEDTGCPLALIEEVVRVGQWVPLPLAGSIGFRFFIQGNEFLCQPALHPVLEPFDMFMYPFFQAFNPLDLLTVVVSLTLERSVVILSRNIALLTPFCKMLISLMAPFAWVHKVFPVCPDHLCGMVESIVPIIVGLHASVSADVKQRIGDMSNPPLLVELDTTKISIHPMCAPPPWPAHLTTNFASRLKRIKPMNMYALGRPIVNVLYDRQFRLKYEMAVDCEFRGAFYSFMLGLLGDVRIFITKDDHFLKDQYLQSKDSDAFEFYAELVDTYAFQFFVASRTPSFRDYVDGLSEKRVVEFTPPPLARFTLPLFSGCDLNSSSFDDMDANESVLGGMDLSCIAEGDESFERPFRILRESDPNNASLINIINSNNSNNNICSSVLAMNESNVSIRDNFVGPTPSGDLMQPSRNSSGLVGNTSRASNPLVQGDWRYGDEQFPPIAFRDVVVHGGETEQPRTEQGVPGNEEVAKNSFPSDPASHPTLHKQDAVDCIVGIDEGRRGSSAHLPNEDSAQGRPKSNRVSFSSTSSASNRSSRAQSFFSEHSDGMPHGSQKSLRRLYSLQQRLTQSPMGQQQQQQQHGSFISTASDDDRYGLSRSIPRSTSLSLKGSPTPLREDMGRHGISGARKRPSLSKGKNRSPTPQHVSFRSARASMSSGRSSIDAFISSPPLTRRQGFQVHKRNHSYGDTLAGIAGDEIRSYGSNFATSDGSIHGDVAMSVSTPAKHRNSFPRRHTACSVASDLARTGEDGESLSGGLAFADVDVGDDTDGALSRGSTAAEHGQLDLDQAEGTEDSAFTRYCRTTIGFLEEAFHESESHLAISNGLLFARALFHFALGEITAAVAILNAQMKRDVLSFPFQRIASYVNTLNTADKAVLRKAVLVKNNALWNYIFELAKREVEQRNRIIVGLDWRKALENFSGQLDEFVRIGEHSDLMPVAAARKIFDALVDYYSDASSEPASAHQSDSDESDTAHPETERAERRKEHSENEKEKKKKKKHRGRVKAAMVMVEKARHLPRDVAKSFFVEISKEAVFDKKIYRAVQLRTNEGLVLLSLAASVVKMTRGSSYATYKQCSIVLTHRRLLVLREKKSEMEVVLETNFRDISDVRFVVKRRTGWASSSRKSKKEAIAVTARSATFEMNDSDQHFLLFYGIETLVAANKFPHGSSTEATSAAAASISQFRAVLRVVEKSHNSAGAMEPTVAMRRILHRDTRNANYDKAMQRFATRRLADQQEYRRIIETTGDGEFKRTVAALAYVEATRSIWCGMSDGLIEVFQSSTYRKSMTIRLHTKRIMALLSHGNCVWTGSMDQTALVIDAHTQLKMTALKTALAAEADPSHNHDEQEQEQEQEQTREAEAIGSKMDASVAGPASTAACCSVILQYLAVKDRALVLGLGHDGLVFGWDSYSHNLKFSLDVNAELNEWAAPSKFALPAPRTEVWIGCKDRIIVARVADGPLPRSESEGLMQPVFGEDSPEVSLGDTELLGDTLPSSCGMTTGSRPSSPSATVIAKRDVLQVSLQFMEDESYDIGTTLVQGGDGDVIVHQQSKRRSDGDVGEFSSTSNRSSASSGLFRVDASQLRSLQARHSHGSMTPSSSSSPRHSGQVDTIVPCEEDEHRGRQQEQRRQQAQGTEEVAKPCSGNVRDGEGGKHVSAELGDDRVSSPLTGSTSPSEDDVFSPRHSTGIDDVDISRCEESDRGSGMLLLRQADSGAAFRNNKMQQKQRDRAASLSIFNEDSAISKIVTTRISSGFCITSPNAIWCYSTQSGIIEVRNVDDTMRVKELMIDVPGFNELVVTNNQVWAAGNDMNVHVFHRYEFYPLRQLSMHIDKVTALVACYTKNDGALVMSGGASQDGRLIVWSPGQVSDEPLLTRRSEYRPASLSAQATMTSV